MVVYTSETGTAHGKFVGPVFLGMPEVHETFYDDYCFICKRCTDHVGEHDDVDAIYEVRETSDGHITWRESRVFPQGWIN